MSKLISRGAAADGEITVVSATDDGYAMPLAVAIRTALDRLHPERRMRLFVLDGGLSDESKSQMLRSWNDSRLRVEWIRPDMRLVGDLMVSDQVTSVTYLRLLMPRLLPKHVTRAIYVDADMLVRRDLADLWDVPQQGAAALAAPCLAAPYIDAEVVLPADKFHACRGALAAIRPVANYRELGLDPTAAYLNGGLLVVDLEQWRRDGFAEKMLACLRNHREHVLWWDQYALNVVLAGRWKPLEYRWNQGAHLFVYGDAAHSPLSEAEYKYACDDPWIVHYCSPSKPWQYFCKHPRTDEFRRALKRTAWADWRPPRPEPFLQSWWDHHYPPLRQQWKAKTRALKTLVGYNRRRAA